MSLLPGQAAVDMLLSLPLDVIAHVLVETVQGSFSAKHRVTPEVPA